VLLAIITDMLFERWVRYLTAWRQSRISVSSSAG